MTQLFRAARYTISPLFLRKSVWLTQFFIIVIRTVPFSDIPVWKYSYFCSDIQQRNQNCNIYLQTLFTDSKEGIYKNQRTVYYEYVNILFNQEYGLVIFFVDQVNDWGRFQRTGPHTRTKITLKLTRRVLPFPINKMVTTLLWKIRQF